MFLQFLLSASPIDDITKSPFLIVTRNLAKSLSEFNTCTASITIPSDFVVETATVIINGAQDNNATATSYADHGILIGSDVKKYGDGTIFPALSTLQTGCVARFWYDTRLEQHVITTGSDPTGYNVRATVLMFGRKP